MKSEHKSPFSKILTYILLYIEHLIAATFKKHDYPSLDMIYLT